MKPSQINLKIFQICAFAICLAPLSAAACTTADVRGAESALPLNGKFNSAVLDAAILSETNFHRCQNGLSPLAAMVEMRKPAQKHSDWMAKKKKLSHTSTQRGLKTLKDRVGTIDRPIRTAAENIAFMPLFNLPSRFQVINRKTCQFQSTNGRSITPHSYRSYAKDVVTLWMNSPGHRRNILGKSTAMSAAAALSADKATCGNVYITQMFAS